MKLLKSISVGFAVLSVASPYAVGEGKDITGFRNLRFGDTVDAVRHALAHPKTNDVLCHYSATETVFDRKTTCEAIEDKIEISGIDFGLTARFDPKTNVLDVIDLTNFLDASPDLYSNMVRGLTAKYGGGKALKTDKRIAAGLAQCEEVKKQIAGGIQLGEIYYQRLAVYNVYLIPRASGSVVIEFKQHRICENLIPEWSDFINRHPREYRVDEYSAVTITYLRAHRSTTFNPNDF